LFRTLEIEELSVLKPLLTFIKLFCFDTRLRPFTLLRVDVLTATKYYTIN